MIELNYFVSFYYYNSVTLLEIFKNINKKNTLPTMDI